MVSVHIQLPPVRHFFAFIDVFCVILWFPYLVICLPVAGARCSVAGAIHSVAGVLCPVAGAGAHYPVAAVIHMAAK